MHACQLVEWSALLAANSGALLASSPSHHGRGLEEYWIASKCRLDRWGMALTMHAAEERAKRADTPNPWFQVRPVLEEILMSETLARVWAAICCAADHRRPGEESDAAPVARNVLAGHLEASSRAMRIVAREGSAPVEEAVEVNRLRRTNERWTDILLSLCDVGYDVRQFAHNSKRLAEFSQSMTRSAHSAPLLAALRIAYRSSLSRKTENGSVNRRIANATLSCFNTRHFGDTGILTPLTIAALHGVAQDHSGSVEQLLAPITETEGSAQGRSFPIRDANRF